MTDAPAREGLLDTSAVLRLSAIADPSLLPEFPLISAVTLADLSVGPLVARDDTERAARQAVLRQVEADFDPLPFDDRAARGSSTFKRSRRRSTATSRSLTASTTTPPSTTR